MRAGDDAFRRLQYTIEELAEEEVAGLVAEARVEARSRVRTILVDALAQAMLDRAQSHIALPGQPPVRAAGASGRSSAPQGASGRSSAPSSASTDTSAAAADDRRTGERAGDGDDEDVRAQAAARRLAEPVETSRASDELGLYAYCVISAPADATLDSLAGVDGRHPVLLVREGPIAALASRVPLDQFGEDSLRESLHDVAWLEATARAHERVLDHVRERTTVIPMRLCTIYRNEASLREMLTRERPSLSEALERLQGRTEWGVKLFVDRDQLDRRIEIESPAVAQLSAEIERASEGEAYLLRRQLQALRAEEADRLLEERCQLAHAALSAAAVDALLNPLQASEVTGHSGDMILNGVYLVDDQISGAFHLAVQELAQAWTGAGLEVQTTGPWPAYNFVKGSIEAAW